MKRGLKFYFLTARGEEVLQLPDFILFLFVGRIIPQTQVKIYILMKNWRTQQEINRDCLYNTMRQSGQGFTFVIFLVWLIRRRNLPQLPNLSGDSAAAAWQI